MVHQWGRLACARGDMELCPDNQHKMNSLVSYPTQFVWTSVPFGNDLAFSAQMPSIKFPNSQWRTELPRPTSHCMRYCAIFSQLQLAERFWVSSSFTNFIFLSLFSGLSSTSRSQVRRHAKRQRTEETATNELKSHVEPSGTRRRRWWRLHNSTISSCE